MGELLTQQRYPVAELYALETYRAEVPPGYQDRLTLVTPKELGRISQLTTPHQVLAVVDLPEQTEELPEAVAQGWSLYLDGIQSPNNLGALLRIADWFGFAYVFGGPGTADLYSAKSIQASMGSFLRIHYRETTLDTLTERFPTLPIFGADLSGTSVYDLVPPPSGSLVIGTEGAGIRAGTQVKINRWLTIPRAPGRSAESLNAAVAAGILCSALRRSGK